MKSRENSRVPEEWKKIARVDWQRMQRNLRSQDAIAAGFSLQQCLEKFLKAFLLIHGWNLKKIHRLDTLLDEAVNYNGDLTIYYALCERVSGYYLADRYPALIPTELTCEDIERELEEARKFIKALFPEEDLNV
jgi:HEPN domain-containing protein